MEKRQVGEMIVTDRGIERVIETGDCGSYTTELIISKEAFQQAYEKYIESKEYKLTPSDLGRMYVVHLVEHDYLFLDAVVDIISKKVVFEVGDKRYKSLKKALNQFYKIIEEDVE